MAKENPTASLNTTRLITHYLMQCVKNGNPDAAVLLLREDVKKTLTEEDHIKLREYLMVIIRQVAGQNVQVNTSNVIKASDLYLNNYKN